MFGKTAENCERYLFKGKLVGIQGRIQTGSYKNKDGETVYTTDVTADRVEFIEWASKKKASDIPSGFEEIQDNEALDESDSDIPF